MNIKSLLTVFFFGFCISSYGYSQTSTDKTITKANISQCKYTNNDTDFCSDENILLYNEKIKQNPNFDENKILFEFYTKKNNKTDIYQDVKNIVIIDPKKNKVYPFKQQLGYGVGNQFNIIYTQPPIVNFNKSKNDFCFSARLFDDPESRLNVENECYRFDLLQKDNFKKVNSTNIKDILENENLVTQNPYSSELHQSCLKDKNQAKCSKLKLVKASKIFELYGSNYSLNPEEESSSNKVIYSISRDSIVLPKNKDGTFLIMAPYQEEDEDGNAIPCINIIIMKGNTVLDSKIVFSGKKPITVDSNNNITYFDYVHGGKKKVISVNKLYK